MKIPDGWKLVALGEHIDLLTGYPFKSECYSEDESDVRLLRGDNVIQGRIRWDDCKRWPSTEYQNLSRYHLHVGDFVIAMDRTWVNSGLKASSITECDVPSLLVQRVARIRCLDDLHNGYLSSLIRSHRFEQYVKGVQTETAIPHISPDQIRELSVSLPPLPEQKAIADTLSTWDAAIEMTERLIASKERWISGFGKQLFRRGRENSSSGWKTVALHEVLHEHGDVSTGNESVYSVSVHKGLVDQIEHLGRSFAAANTSNYNRVHFGDVVYTKSPTGDFPLGIFKQSTVDMDVIVSPLYGVFTPQTFELGVILDFFFSSPVNAKNYLNPLIQKGAKNTINITNTTFLRGQICLPMDPGEQKKMCDLIQATRDEILTLQSILDKLKLQKRGLMQKLLTGTWRVPVRNKVAT